MDNLTHNLNEMIRYQRLAKQANDAGLQDYHHREAMRYRLLAHKLERQGRVLQGLTESWLNLN